MSGEPDLPISSRASAPRIIIDLDDTLTIDLSDTRYADKSPRQDVINRLQEFRELGYSIVVFSARNMQTFEGEIGKINVHTLPGVLEWLARNRVPFDEVIMGKPWCGKGGFYVDDKTIRPDEFARLSPAEIMTLVGEGAPGG